MPQNNFTFDITNVSNFNLSFLVDVGKTSWFHGEEKQNDDFLNQDLKEQIPKNQIFRINSLIFNITKHKREILSKYDCYYDEESNSLSLLLSEDICYSDFTKEIMINLLDFTQKVGIDVIYFLVAKKNQQYLRIIKDLMIVGFEVEENVKNTTIDGQVYKILKMPVSEESEEIEEVMF